MKLGTILVDMQQSTVASLYIHRMATDYIFVNGHKAKLH